MHRSLSHRWALAVTGAPRRVIGLWVAVSVLAWAFAPSWKEIAYDGDFEYLPATMTSVAGGRLLDAAFPGERSRSQIVLVLGRHEGALTEGDRIVGLDLLRRLYHRLGAVSWRRAIDYGYEGGSPRDGAAWNRWLQLARSAFDLSIATDERFYEAIAGRVPDEPPTAREPRMAIAYWDRGRLLEAMDGSEDAIGDDYQAALTLAPDLPKTAVPIESRDLSAWEPLLDVLSWDDPALGSQLRSEGALLTVLKLSTELAATKNIEAVEATDALIERVLGYSQRFTDPGLELLMTGSAAIGGQTLLAARDAIRYTEWFTVLMILVILAVVYRAPLLVAIPMISIGVAVVVSSGLVALLTQWSIEGVVPWLDLRVFTTSRIFVVVILFGAGTDYCLFLISRLREEAWLAPWGDACSRALEGVTGALLGSALTTIFGLGMLWIADFGKFHYTGPIIAVCLFVGLLVCTSLTPALLRLAGPIAFWPGVTPDPVRPPVSLLGRRGAGGGSGVWGAIAVTLTRRPLMTLTAGLALLAAPGVYGYLQERNVTYDLSSQLSPSASSRRGLDLLSQHFAIGEVNPVTVVLVRPEATSREELEADIRRLSRRLYALPGVVAVRTADDPLGDFPPTREMSLLSPDAWRRRALKNHRLAQRYFFSSHPAYEDQLTRLDVVIDGDPFSTETAALVEDLREFLVRTVSAESSRWQGSQLWLTGTTPSIIDLREVTLADNRRIKVAVILAVFVVLMLVIRRLVLCLYLIGTVLLSYFATLGLTVLFFRALYGDDFVGLDWKLPLFLFVILVAVGQDYNVYLVTRILEEQRRLGWLAAVRRAVARTGGIITACGLVMAATFLSMTASAWAPPLAAAFGLADPVGSEHATLRGIVELGFALGLGVLIDTFYVRTILVPSFVAAAGRWLPGRVT